MHDLNLEDVQVRADIETVGRDFDEYGGDIPLAIVTTARIASESWKGDPDAAVEVMAMALSASDVSKRMKPIADACARLHDITQNDHWLVPALKAYSELREVPRDVEDLLRRGADQLMALEPNWQGLARVMWGIHGDTQAALSAVRH